jgi:hypothetical protein
VLQPAGFDDATTDIPFGLEPLESSGRGHALGIEFLAQKRLGVLPIYGQAALSFNRTRFTGTNGATAPGAFDTPLLANVVLGWRPSSRYEVALRARAASGLPETPFITDGPNAGTLDFARYNGVRGGSYFATDVRLDRRFIVRGTQLIAFLDVQNVTGRGNAGRATWDPRTRQVERSTGIGRLPTIGLNWEF